MSGINANQRLCAGLGGKPCFRRLSPLERDPHPTCPSCRGKVCTRQDPCPVCFSWPDLQWRLYESRRLYKRKGGSTPVPGGEGGPVAPVTPSGGQALVPVPQRQLQDGSGVSGGSLLGGAPLVSNMPVCSLPATATTSSAPTWASTSHFQYSTLPSLANPSQCHAGSLVSSAPVLTSAAVSSSLASSSHPSLHSHLPSSTPYLTPQQWLGYQNQWFQGGYQYGVPQPWAPPPQWFPPQPPPGVSQATMPSLQQVQPNPPPPGPQQHSNLLELPAPGGQVSGGGPGLSLLQPETLVSPPHSRPWQ